MPMHFGPAGNAVREARLRRNSRTSKTVDGARGNAAQRYPQALRLGIIVGLLLAFAVPVVHFMVVFPFVHEIPMWDQWSLIPLWEAHFAQEPVLPHLLSPYNGHYNVVPRLIFYGVGRATDWNVRTEVVLSYTASTLTLAVLLLMLRDSGRKFLLLAPLVSLQVFSLIQFENFLSGYPFGQHLSQLAATTSLYLLTRPRVNSRHLLAAGVAAMVATLSWGAGLVAWGVGTVAIGMRVRRLDVIFTWLLGFGLSALVVWVGASSLGLEGRIPWASPDLWTFPFALIGKVALPEGFPTVMSATVSGAVLVGVFIVATVGNFLSGQRDLLIRWGLLGLLALGGASLVALGRAFAGLEQALASHYATTAYPFMVATLVLAVSCLLGRYSSFRPCFTRWFILAATALLLYAVVSPVRASLRTYLVIRSWEGVRTEMLYRLVGREISDAEIRRYFHPKPPLVRRGLVLLERHGLSGFRTAGLGCPADLTISNITLTGGGSYNAGTTVNLGPDLKIAGTDVTVFAGERVVFTNGTIIGGRFRIRTGAGSCAH
jgi:hypothetical protein